MNLFLKIKWTLHIQASYILKNTRQTINGIAAKFCIEIWQILTSSACLKPTAEGLTGISCLIYSCEKWH